MTSTLLGVPRKPIAISTLLLVCALVSTVWRSFGDESGTLRIDGPTQEKVLQLIQDALAPKKEARKSTNAAWEGGLRVEKDFREASRLIPERLDLRFNLATALVGLAAQTNGPLLELKIHDALKTYQEIWALDTNGFQAPILYAAYSRAIGETNGYETTICRLMKSHPKETVAYVERFERVEAFLALTPNETLSRDGLKDKQHALVVLGAGLETNGTVKPKLVGRLHQALRLARAYPAAPIILTGGNQKGGVTESYAMRQWLLRHGVSEKRLHLEDLAKDTVGNALYSATILDKLKVTDVTVVTSVSHMRRGLADLEEACLAKGLHLHYANLAAATEEPILDPKAERIGTYRDVMRISGIWAHPGISR
jgi:hypothetical protein